MLSDNGDNFTVVLNSQATGANIQAIDGNGYKKYFNCLPSLLAQSKRDKKFRISVNLVSVITAESTLAAAPLYLLELSTGATAQNIYQNGTACVSTSSILIPLEPYPSVTTTTALVSSYWFCKNNFTGRCPTDLFEVRIRNASDFKIQSAFPNYVLQVTFEEVLETKVF